MTIRISGASEHNLKNLDLEIGEAITAVSGVSGSGKTSLIFDTLYHEARRRFLEVYAVGAVAERMAPAEVAEISGLGPAVALGQNLLNRNPNSTLASATGLYPLLRILYARFGRRACPDCGQEMALLTEDEAVERLVALSGSSSGRFYASLVQGAFGSHQTLITFLIDRFGQTSLWIDGAVYKPYQALDPRKKHDLAVMIHDGDKKLSAAEGRELVQKVRMLGSAVILAGRGAEKESLSLAPICSCCGFWFSTLEPTHFHRSCPHCSGEGCRRCSSSGLWPEAAAVRWQERHMQQLLALSVSELHELVDETEWMPATERLRQEIERRLEALLQVGLGYLTLNRPSPSLSRGEAQRARLAVTLTSHLEDLLHIFDEPTIGQHAVDTRRFLPVLRSLPGPVIYVEHDKIAIAAADEVIDLGPGPGQAGGHIVFKGQPAGLWRADTASGRYFSGKAKADRPRKIAGADQFVWVKGANVHNLQDIDVRFPLGYLTAVTGVSGSGKSTLVEHVLARSLKSKEAAGCHSIEGPLLRPVVVDQSPIGRNPRSNPATYSKLADIVRELYAAATGLSPSHFSFNRPEGACPACNGMGAIEIKMRYLPSSWIPCSQCDGLRFKDEVLAAKVEFDGRSASIADFYRLTVTDARELLRRTDWLSQAKLRAAERILRALVEIGLGYLTLGQPSPTLSGGEAQRVKLAKFLGRRALNRQILLLDEPTTGLHDQDVSVLLAFLDRLTAAGGTVIAVEHNLDFICSADWIVELGPGAGPQGGRVLFNGPVGDFMQTADTPTADALRMEDAQAPEPASEGPGIRLSENIQVRNARMHNLQGIDVVFQKNQLTAVTGVSGSGKSSLVWDVLETEARRRFLETLSLYERQAVSEGPEADVSRVTGLGVTIAVGADEAGGFDQRATMGSATEIARHLAALLAWSGDRACTHCGRPMARIHVRSLLGWRCPQCGQEAAADPRLFLATTYAAACQICNGVGTLQIPNPDKLIIDPGKPLCSGAMHSPGFFPKGYLCKPLNHGYYMVRALGERYGFDPAQTPWQEMSEEAQQAFLYGDDEPMLVHFQSRTQSGSREVVYPGFYGFIRDWDVGGTYTDTKPCPACHGAQLRPSSLAVHLGGYNMHQLSSIPLEELAQAVSTIRSESNAAQANKMAMASWQTIARRLAFLQQVGLGYLQLQRKVATLSAGEIQRIRLAGLLGSGLRSLTILVDEPTRGLHPSEVDALVEALHELRDEGNTVIVVEHDAQVIKQADQIVDMGPGAGRAGGRVVAQGNPQELAKSDTATGRWLRAGDRLAAKVGKREPTKWMTIAGARGNNLRGGEVPIPLGTLTGICGVSGSGKSTLLIDTVGRALAPKKYTTSVASETLEPAPYEAIRGAPERTILVDQSKAGVSSPVAYLGLERPLRRLFAATGDAMSLGIDEGGLQRKCSACKGRGRQRFDMGFLPSVQTPCALCQGSGFLPEAWEICWQGICLPDLVALTIEEAYERLQDEEKIALPLAKAIDVGLGYLVLRQPGAALSGGEAQRLKIAKELARQTRGQTLFILDEPTVGLHQDDVQTLLTVLIKLVEEGHTVVVIEHHVSLLAACDWLLELGPGGGPRGGRLIASGNPSVVAQGETPTAPYLRKVMRTAAGGL